MERSRKGPWPHSIFCLILCAFALTFSVTSLAQAEQIETDNELLQQGLELYEELEYERAVETLSAALLEPSNSVSERLLIFQTLGTLYVFLNRDQEASLALTRLLCVDPSFEFSEYASPRIREVFDRVRQQWRDEGSPCEEQAVAPRQLAPVSLDHESPVEASQGEALEIEVTIDDPELRVASVLLNYRASGEQGYNETSATMTQPGRFTATIPGDVVQSPAAEYFIRAVTDNGETLDELGTQRAPLRVPVRGGEESGGIARQWWFWTIIGVVVVGAGLGLGLGLGLNQEDPTPSDGTLTVVVCDGENTDICFNR